MSSDPLFLSYIYRRDLVKGFHLDVHILAKGTFGITDSVSWRWHVDWSICYLCKEGIGTMYIFCLNALSCVKLFQFCGLVLNKSKVMVQTVRLCYSFDNFFIHYIAK